VPVEYFKNIRSDLQKSIAAGFVVSTTDKLLHAGVPDKRIFDLLLKWLNSLNNIQYQISNIVSTIDSYIVTLLNCLGYDINQVKSNPDHDFIYQFLLFHTDRKIADWANLTK